MEADRVADTWDAGAGAETQYLIGPARIVWQVGSHSGAGFQRDARITWNGTDLLGTVGAVVDLVSGSLLERSTYLPSGVRETFRMNDDVAAVQAEPLGFTGKEADEEVGLAYFGHRYLMPHLGRWASPDPLQVHQGGGGEFGNSYHYVAGNLLQATDPTGLEKEAVISMTVGWMRDPAMRERSPNRRRIETEILRDNQRFAQAYARRHDDAQAVLVPPPRRARGFRAAALSAAAGGWERAAEIAQGGHIIALTGHGSAGVGENGAGDRMPRVDFGQGFGVTPELLRDVRRSRSGNATFSGTRGAEIAAYERIRSSLATHNVERVTLMICRTGGSMEGRRFLRDLADDLQTTIVTPKNFVGSVDGEFSHVRSREDRRPMGNAVETNEIPHRGVRRYWTTSAPEATQETSPPGAQTDTRPSDK